MKRVLFVVACLFAVAALGFAGGQNEPAEPQESGAPAAVVASGEAPMLAERVAAGELPPVEERLPEDPHVVIPSEGIGQYGGTLRIIDTRARLDFALRLRHTGLFRYDMGVSQAVPDLASGYEWNDDTTELTITLRRGLHWSDGDDFTTEDIQWWWDHVIFDQRIFPGGPGGRWTFNVDGETRYAELIVHDDYSFTYKFPVPNPVAMDAFARTHFSGDGELFGASHWLEQFHADFVDADVLNERAEALGFVSDDQTEAWVQFFNVQRATPYNTPTFDLSRPVIDMYVPIEITQDQVIQERNPYFHHVDPEGNQLPYIDRMVVTSVPDAELRNLKFIAGEADWSFWGSSFSSMELYRANEESGNYRTVVGQMLDPNIDGVYFNVTTPDPAKRALLSNVEFRKALSIAVDRQRVNDVLFFGLAEPHPPAPRKEMPWYDPAWTNDKWTVEYDPDEANQMLDDLGLSQRNAQGIRLMENGEPLRLSLLVESDTVPGEESWEEMFRTDMRAIGVDINVRAVQLEILEDLHDNNETELLSFGIGRGTVFGRATPDIWGYERPGANWWGGQYALWFTTQGQEGIEPPQEVKDHQALWEEFRRLDAGDPRAAELGREYYQFFMDNYFFFGGPGTAPFPYIVHNRIRNFPTGVVTQGSDHNGASPFVIDSWWIDE